MVAAGGLVVALAAGVVDVLARGCVDVTGEAARAAALGAGVAVVAAGAVGFEVEGVCHKVVLLG